MNWTVTSILALLLIFSFLLFNTRFFRNFKKKTFKIIFNLKKRMKILHEKNRKARKIMKYHVANAKKEGINISAEVPKINKINNETLNFNTLRKTLKTCKDMSKSDKKKINIICKYRNDKMFVVIENNHYNNDDNNYDKTPHIQNKKKYKH